MAPRYTCLAAVHQIYKDRAFDLGDVVANQDLLCVERESSLKYRGQTLAYENRFLSNLPEKGVELLQAPAKARTVPGRNPNGFTSKG